MQLVMVLAGPHHGHELHHDASSYDQHKLQPLLALKSREYPKNVSFNDCCDDTPGQGLGFFAVGKAPGVATHCMVQTQSLISTELADRQICSCAREAATSFAPQVI